MENAKVPGRFWTTSQDWFQNNFWNHVWMIHLVRIWANVFYRKRRQFWNPVTSRFQVIFAQFGTRPTFFWSWSHVWFQKNFRNHDWIIRLADFEQTCFTYLPFITNMAKISLKINKIEIWPKSRPKVINSQNKSHADHIWGMFEL